MDCKEYMLGCINALDCAAPEIVTLKNKALLKEAALQDQVMKNPNKGTIAKRVLAVSDASVRLEKYELLDASLQHDANAAIHCGKLACGVDFVLLKIEDMKKLETVQEQSAMATATKKTISEKKVIIPKFLTAVTVNPSKITYVIFH